MLVGAQPHEHVCNIVHNAYHSTQFTYFNHMRSSGYRARHLWYVLCSIAQLDLSTHQSAFVQGNTEYTLSFPLLYTLGSVNILINV